MSENINVAVVGASGAVGEAIASILQDREFPVAEFFPVASENSAGSRVEYKGKYRSIADVANFDFSKVKLVFFCAGNEVSAKYVPLAVEAGCVVIDNSDHFRNEDEVPLVVPEVNPEDIAQYKQRNIIANPNCSTIQMMVALKPIHDAVGIERINVATYQAVSGSGKQAVDELAKQTIQLLNMKEVESSVYAKQIAFNVFPAIGDVMENGYTKEEMKIVWESKKVLHDETIQVNPTTVRVPVFYGHSEALHIETRKKITAKQVRELLEKAPGIEVVDSLDEGGYPTPVSEAAGNDEVYVGRVREDLSHPQGINMWVVADNVRKGAALNSVQIAEILVKEYL